MNLLFAKILAACLLLPPGDGQVTPDAKAAHWAFQPVVRPAAPEVADKGWVRNPIDAFILARLQRAGIRPSPEADRTTLIRRLSLDLLGLPPSPPEVDQFLADQRPDAYERLVDRLLASPHYGERWGRHWLDAARYADSNGYTIDGSRSIWKYRDWVIDALNRDLLFDQFTIEQIAGDMLPNATTDQIIATGFHRNTLRNEEGGTDPEQFRVEAVVDRVSTTGSVFLGMTLGCARCHDHKYDPISQHEFYRFFALLNNADEPTLKVTADEQVKKELPALEVEIAQEEKRLTDTDAGAGTRQAEWERQVARRLDVNWTVLEPAEFRSAGEATISKLEDKSVLVGGNIPSLDTYTVVADAPVKGVTAVRLEVLTHDSLPKRGPGLASNGNFILSEIGISARPATVPADASPQDTPVAIVRAVADHSQDNYLIEHAIDGEPKTGWAINVKAGSMNVDRTAIFITKDDVGAESGARLTITLQQNQAHYSIGRFRLSVTDGVRDLVALPEAARQALVLAPDDRTAEQKKLLTEEFRKVDKERIPLVAKIAELKQRLKQLSDSITTSLVMQERKEPRMTHVHVRGDFLRPGTRVEPGVPAVLPPLVAAGDTPSRLDLAKWLVSTQNPLTPRVTANRLWQQYFGQGIVATENDFGTQSSPPTHPELLDWLAAEFIARGWSLKAMHRLIVTSATYQQASRLRPELNDLDPENKLLARQARLRLEAEAVRDVALAASDLLSHEIGGPGIYPPQPEGVYRFTQNVKFWKESQGADRYRRGMYTYFWRSSPHPLFATFDAPDATVTCTRRNRSNTPLQALTLANEKAFFEMAQALAARVLGESPASDDERIRYAYRLCFARVPEKQEHQRLMEFLQTQRNRFQQSPQDATSIVSKNPVPEAGAPEAAAWTAVARVLMNLDEFITRE